uniref:Reverse transcriptase domain-containing protein n=1 Tax=Tanacetum cinerariifolium TaxID=118510 RepID=A0A6L2JCY8_TANCI|nr:hypothetical protein [Tanacetum cinerariifolium]
MARMDAMTMKMDAQYKELQSRSKQPNPDNNDDDIPMPREEEEKFMQPSIVLMFTMITVIQTEIIGVQAGETITTETTINLIMMINLTFKNN